MQVGCFQYGPNSWNSKSIFIAVGKNYIGWDSKEDAAVSKADSPTIFSPYTESLPDGLLELSCCVVGNKSSHDGRDHVLELGDCRNFVPSVANTTFDIHKKYFSFKDAATCNTFTERLRASIASAGHAAIQSVMRKQLDTQEGPQNSTIIRMSIPINDEYHEYPKTKRILRDKKKILESGLSLAFDHDGEPVVPLAPLPSLKGIVFPANCVELHLDNHNLKTIDDAAFPPCLTVLSMNGNRMSTFEQSQFPAGLTRLSLNYNDFKTLEAVKFPEGLRELYLDDCGIQSTGLYGFVFPQGLSLLSLKKNKKMFQKLSALSISKLLPTGCAELYLDECDIAAIVGVDFPQSLSVLSLKKNMISSVGEALFPTSCTHLDLSFNQISTFEGVVFPTGCKAIINDQQVTNTTRQQVPDKMLSVTAHGAVAGSGAVTLNIQLREQESECCFQLSEWLPGKTRCRVSLIRCYVTS